MTCAPSGGAPPSHRYYGGKNHLYQLLINRIPRHRLYVEPFAGSAAVARHLASNGADRLLIERDPEQVNKLRAWLPGVRVECGNALEILKAFPPARDRGAFLFVDPPYPVEDRRDPRQRYLWEMNDQDHRDLAKLLLPAAAAVMVCGFPWGLYAELFKAWKRYDFKVILRSGKIGRECIWTNYTDPFPLHDYRYFGADRSTRQDHRRKVSRFVSKLRRMDRHQRQAVLEAIRQEFGP